jgi:hypothetical protein
MRKTTLRFIGAIALATTMLAGCSKQDSSKDEVTPAGESTINYSLTAVNTSGTVTTDGAGTARLSTIMNDQSMAALPSLKFDLTWDSILFRYRELKFAAVSGPDEISLNVKTDRDINLLDSSSIGSVLVPLGAFQQVRVYVRAEGDSIRPAVKLNGRITWLGDEIPVDIVLIGKLELLAEGENVVISEAGIGLLGSLKIDLSVILTKLKIGDFEGDFNNGKLTLRLNLDKDPDNGLKKALEGSMSVSHDRQ